MNGELFKLTSVVKLHHITWRNLSFLHFSERQTFWTWLVWQIWTTVKDSSHYPNIKVKIDSSNEWFLHEAQVFTFPCLCLMVCALYSSRALLFPASPLFANFKAIFQQRPYMKLHHLELHLHYTWKGVDIKRHFLQYFQSPHKEKFVWSNILFPLTITLSVKQGEKKTSHVGSKLSGKNSQWLST